MRKIRLLLIVSSFFQAIFPILISLILAPAGTMGIDVGKSFADL